MARNNLPSFPWGDHDQDPFNAFRKSIDSVFKDWNTPSGMSDVERFMVKSNVSETEDEVCVTAELPGVDEKDIDISISGTTVTIKGQKSSEKEEKNESGREFHRIERTHGSFHRSMTLPFDIDADKVQAEFS
ncbi:MAG: Hsp20/alpha crystallin family protein, partial [Methyloligellaceae bacterium]